MKKLLVLSMFIGGLLGVLVNNALAEDRDWKKTEHNYSIKYKEYGVSLRNYFRDDYSHVEFTQDRSIKLPGLVAQDIEIGLRIAEHNDVIETRPKLTHSVVKFKWHDLDFDIKQRVSYRHFDNESQSDFIRYRTTTKVSWNDLYYVMQPRWVFQKSGESNDLKVDDVKTQIGMNFKIDPLVKFSPYVQIMLKGHDEKYARDDMMLGTKLQIKF